MLTIFLLEDIKDVWKIMCSFVLLSSIISIKLIMA